MKNKQKKPFYFKIFIQLALLVKFNNASKKKQKNLKKKKITLW